MAAITPSAGGSLNSVPSPVKAAITTNYLDFTSGSNDWSQQYLPDLIEQEAEVYGKRTISGFLSAIGAEEAMSSDQVVWTEQGRLHLSYKVTGFANGSNTGDITLGQAPGSSASAASTHGIRIGQTVLVSDGQANPVVFRGLVTHLPAGNKITVAPYTTGDASGDVADVSGINTTTLASSGRVFVYGSEFGKGTNGMGETTGNNPVMPQFTTFNNKPIILKDHYSISGSDTSRIGWVEVSAEDGTSGYLWYLKAEAETRLRFADYLEMSLLESEKGTVGGSVADNSINGAGEAFGTEGLFKAITDRGHVTAGIAGTSAVDDLGSFDEILKKFDEQGAIEEYMLYCNRTVSLAIDDMLAAQNSYGAGGTSYGVFSNSEDMALNLGFSGFRRASYDFYKSDWRYLNDISLRGQDAFNDIRGVLIPAGTSTVYDEVVGRSMRRPFLHVRYRASQTDDRRMKTWITGSVGGNITSDLDAMEINFLSERCLVVQGANNFMLLN